MSKKDDSLKRNGSGVYDPTAYIAIVRADNERDRYHNLMRAIQSMCERADFKIESRIVLRDKKTGRIWG